MAVDKDKRFAPGPASSYARHQVQDKITIAAMPYITKEQSEIAFGKAKPYEHGILPVLVIIDNGTGKALRLDLQAELVDSRNRHQEALPPGDVVLRDGVKKAPRIPGTGPNPIPIPRTGVKKGPLNTWEIEGRAFSATLLPPGESAHGFFYFDIGYNADLKLYLSGIKDAASGQEYFYFEVPLEKPPK
jgi:hypothetical protein